MKHVSWLYFIFPFWISFRSWARVSAVPQLGRKGSVPARSNSGAPKRSSCSLKQQLLISQAGRGEQSLDTFPKNVQNLNGVLNVFFPQNQKSETERLRRAQLSVCLSLSLSLQGAPLAPLPPLLCDSRLPSPLSTRASVTKGVVLRAHFVLFSSFRITTKRRLHSNPQQFIIVLILSLE